MKNITHSGSTLVAGRTQDGTESIFMTDAVDALIKAVPTLSAFRVKQIFLPIRGCGQRSECDTNEAHPRPVREQFAEQSHTGFK